MKRFCSLLLSLFVISSISVFAQESTNNRDSIDNSKNYVYRSAVLSNVNPDFAKWSISIEPGLNVFMGDMSIDYGQTFKKPFDHWSLGGTVEYTFNPLFSLGLAYNYNTVACEDEGGSFTSTIHNVYPFVGFNIWNLANRRGRNIVGFWLTAGVGYAHYDSELTYKNRANSPLFEDTPDIQKEKSSMSSAVMPIGALLEFNITRNFALGLRYQHSLYTMDNLEGGKKLRENDPYGRKNYNYDGVSNDVLANMSLTLRWKFVRSGNEHMRTVAWEEFKPNPNDVLALANSLKDDIDGLKDRMDNAEGRIGNLEDEFANFTPVIVTPADCECTATEPMAVYFDFDKHNLDKDALITISKVARIMQEDESLNLEIRGYTDIVGGNPYNNRLSQLRADRVKNELVNIWGISASRISANGEGKATEPAPNKKEYHPINRRCDFFFSK